MHLSRVSANKTNTANK